MLKTPMNETTTSKIRKNPFLFGAIVKPPHFADRKQEFRDMTSDLASGQHIIMYSPRRYGKTSLILKVLKNMEQDYLTAYIDLFEITSKQKFVEKYVNGVVPKGKIEEVAETVKKYLPGILPKITLGENISIEFEAPKIEKTIDEILDLPQKIANKKRKRMIVVFDEFQEIKRLGTEDMENIMRSKFQHHDMVSYVFLGSKRHLFDEIFKDRNRPFFKFGKQMVLDKLPKDEFHTYIKDGFNATGKKIDDVHINKILSITNCHPYYTQQLAHEIWNLSNLTVNEKDIENSIENVLRDQSYAYELIWDSLGNYSRSLLLGIAIENNNIYSMPFITKYNLNSATNVQKALQTLKKKELIEIKEEKHYIEDIFFEQWLKKRMSTV